MAGNKPGRRIDVLLGELGPIISLGLRQILQSDPHVLVVGETGDHIALEAGIAQLAPQVVVLGEAGVARRSVSSHLQAVHSSVGIVVLAHVPTRADRARLLSNGVAACVPTDAPASTIIEAIHLASEGRQLVESSSSRSPGPNYVGMHDLTLREREVLELLSQRYRNSEIAHALNISLSTTRTHIRHIFRKLEVDSRLKLIGSTAHR